MTFKSSKWGAAFGRLPIVILVAAVLSLAGSIVGAQEVDDDADEEREAAPPPAPAVDAPRFSIVRLETSVPLNDLVSRLESGIPRRIGSPDVWTAYNDTLEVRYAIERDSLKFELDGYDFTVTCSGHYWLSTRGRGTTNFGEAHCGTPEEPIGITFGFRGRMGWKPGWTLGARLLPDADIFALRCKPKPPGHNFTKFLERQIQSGFDRPLGLALEEEIDRFTVEPMVEAAWKGLSEPQDLFEGQVWLDWHPRSIEADPAGGKGESLEMRLSFVTEAVIRVGDKGPFKISPVPDPVVLVADDFAKIPVDVDLSLEPMDRHVLDRLKNSGEERPFREIGGLRIGGEGDRLTVEILPEGAAKSGISLAGTLVFDSKRSAVLVRDLDWTPGSRDLAGKRFPGIEPAAFREKLERELAFDIQEELQAKRQLIPKAFNRMLSDSVSTHGAMLGFVAEKPEILGSRLRMRHWAFGPAWIDVGGAE